jgi:cellulose synthase/poly-beta-1,6-N-acetylglucosamine synthase-like glycosyltransferase
MSLFILLFTALLIIGYILLLFHYRKSWQTIPDFIITENKETRNSTFISVIVAARNEENNIGKLIDAIIKQNYPSHLFELIIVDDHSTDRTAEIIKPFLSNQIQLISLCLSDKATIAYKKAAIDAGIKNSKGELIITTDADCIMSENWLSTIAAFYELHHPKMMVMPVVIKNNHSFLGLFQTLDFMSLQGITGAAVHQKIHGMCNGANLAYTRKVYDEVNGFEGIDHIASGDDMLLMHKISKKYKNEILFLKSKNVIVETEPETNITDFINQRIRWASKADKYEDKSLFPVLLLVYLINVFLIVMFICGMFFNFEFLIFNFYFSYFLLLTIKTAAELSFLSPVSRFFGYAKLLWWFPLFQPFHILYTVVAGWMGKFGSYKWKGRPLK